MGENILRNAPQEQCFRLANGRVLKNLHELANALVSMDERTFSHHVTPARNDFSNWIAGVFGEEELARQIRGLRSREEISRKLGEALKEAGKRYLAQKIERKRQEQKKVYAVQKAQKAPVQLSEVPHGEQKKDAAEQPPARQEEEPARQSPAQKDAAIGEKLEALFRRGVDFIFHRLLDGEQDNYFPVLEYIDDEIDIIEGKLSGTPSNDLLTSILALKHSISLLRKTTLQQTEKLSFLVKNDYRFLSKHALPYFRDIYDHSIRVSDLIDNYREAIINTFEFYMSAVSKNMNEAVKVLSVIATIALPLTVVSSIYGTNFTNLPGSGFHYGFWVMIGFMIVLSGSLVYFLRRRGWA